MIRHFNKSMCVSSQVSSKWEKKLTTQISKHDGVKAMLPKDLQTEIYMKATITI